MILGELVECIIMIIIGILICAEIKFRTKVSYYKGLGYKNPKEQADRGYCILISTIQIIAFVAIAFVIRAIIIYWNEPIYINN